MDKQFINLTNNYYFCCKKFQLKESVKRQKYIIHKSEKNFFKYNSFISNYVEQILGYVIKTAAAYMAVSIATPEVNAIIWNMILRTLKSKRMPLSY